MSTTPTWRQAVPGPSRGDDVNTFHHRTDAEILLHPSATVITLDTYDFPMACEKCQVPFVAGELIGFAAHRDARIVHEACIDDARATRSQR